MLATVAKRLVPPLAGAALVVVPADRADLAHRAAEETDPAAGIDLAEEIAPEAEVDPAEETDLARRDLVDPPPRRAAGSPPSSQQSEVRSGECRLRG